MIFVNEQLINQNYTNQYQHINKLIKKMCTMYILTHVDIKQFFQKIMENFVWNLL